MRQYEAVVIFSSLLAGTKLDEVKKNFEDHVVKQGGKVLGSRETGKRSFGFAIKKQREGLYYVYDFELDPSKVDALKKNWTLTEGILRFSVLLKVIFPAPQIHHADAPKTVSSVKASNPSQR